MDYLKIALSKQESKQLKQQLYEDFKDIHRPKIKQMMKYYSIFSNSELLSLFKDTTYSSKIIRKYFKTKYEDFISEGFKEFWYIFADVYVRKKDNQNNYNLIQNINYSIYFDDTIKKDVVRTYQGKNDPTLLQRVLTAYARRNPLIGYCQGFNYIAAYFLESFSDEDSFWLLVHLFETILPPNFYNNLLGVFIEDKILRAYLQTYNPQLIKQLEILSVETTLFSIQWFVCCFTHNNIKIKDFIMNIILIEGFDALVKSAITFISLMERNIYQCTDIGEFDQMLQNFMKSFEDKQAFLEIYRKIYLNKQFIQYYREEQSRDEMDRKTEKQQSVVMDFLGRKAEQLMNMSCNIEQPLCIWELELRKVQEFHIDYFEFRSESFQIFDQYRPLKVRPYVQEYKALLITRVKHSCKLLQQMLAVEQARKQQNKKLSYASSDTNTNKSQPSQIRSRSPLNLLLMPLKLFESKQDNSKQLETKSTQSDSSNSKSFRSIEEERHIIKQQKEKSVRLNSPSYRHKKKVFQQMPFIEHKPNKVHHSIRESESIKFLHQLVEQNPNLKDKFNVRIDEEITKDN
ncbi:hypothetical protein pb186bvf_006359 [Paramecium bursaria]